MKTLIEIKEYCKYRCKETDCKGKYLKLARRDHKLFGHTIIHKGDYYCSRK